MRTLWQLLLGLLEYLGGWTAPASDRRPPAGSGEHRAAPSGMPRRTRDHRDGEARTRPEADGRAPQAATATRGDGPSSPERRSLLVKLSIALGGIATVAVGVPVVGFFFSPTLRRDREAWRPVGTPDQFPIGATVKAVFEDPAPLPWSGPVAQNAVWVRRQNTTEFVGLSVYCTHTGCPVNWTEGAQLFLCPCHGGAFYRDGSVAAGPPTRPLTPMPVRVRDGVVEVLVRPIPPHQ